MIYLIANYEENICKIGYSNRPEARLMAVQTGCPYPLYLCGTTEGDIKLEQSLHKKFSKYAISGEWFVLSDEIKSYFNSVDKSSVIFYPDFASLLVRLPHSDLKVLLCLLGSARADNSIEIDSYSMATIIERSGLKESTIRNAVSRLTKKNILSRKQANWYILNPEIFFKGKEIAHAKMFELTYQWNIKPLKKA